MLPRATDCILQTTSNSSSGEMSYLGLVLAALLVIFITTLWRVVVHLTWRPFVIQKTFKKQGVDGPGYRFWSGSIDEIKGMKKNAREIVMDVHSHDIIPRIQPHYLKWLSQYGGVFLYWFGPVPRVCITDPELVKQILSNKFGFYTKTKPNPSIFAILGKGLVLTEGSDWARHRRVVSPAFTLDKLKMMTKEIAECTLSMLQSWKDQVIQAQSQQKAIEVNRQFQELTADVISHTAFGSSYAEGKEVFLAQKELMILAIATILNVDIPGCNYLPTRTNLCKWKLERQVKNTLMSIIQSRLDSESPSYGNDLLGVMMEACRADSSQKKKGLTMTMDEIIDECKTFFFAGHETTSHLLTWTMFLLSTNLDWQERLREEVISECGQGVPNPDMISKLKLVNMVILEALRLYCPAIMMLRKADRDMNLGSLMIPKGTSLTIPVLIIHRSKEVWGEDANEFNPQRFENGIANASRHPNGLLAFSIGPRACVGQNFALLEAKMVIAMILQRFSFSISPEYKHMPLDKITLQPQFGLPIVLRPLHV